MMVVNFRCMNPDRDGGETTVFLKGSKMFKYTLVLNIILSNFTYGVAWLNINGNT